MTRRLATLAAVALLGALAAVPLPAAAQELGAEILDETAAPYRVTAFSDPPQGAAGEQSFFAVRILGVGGDRPVVGASVSLSLTNPRDGQTREAVLAERPDLPGVYETPLVLPNPGQWPFALAIRTASGLVTVTGRHTVLTPAEAPMLPNEVARVMDGLYEIVVSARPEDPVEGLGSRFSVRAIASDTREAPPDATVIISFTNPETGRTDDVELDRLPLNPEFHQSLVTFITSGEWPFTVVVESSLGLGTAEGSLLVRDAPSGGLGGTVLWIVATAILVGGGFAFWRAFLRGRAELPGPRR